MIFDYNTNINKITINAEETFFLKKVEASSKEKFYSFGLNSYYRQVLKKVISTHKKHIGRFFSFEIIENNNYSMSIRFIQFKAKDDGFILHLVKNS